MILGRKFCVYLHFSPLFMALHHGVSMNVASDKASFCKIQTRYKLKAFP